MVKTLEISVVRIVPDGKGPIEMNILGPVNSSIVLSLFDIINEYGTSNAVERAFMDPYRQLIQLEMYKIRKTSLFDTRQTQEVVNQ